MAQASLPSHRVIRARGWEPVPSATHALPPWVGLRWLCGAALVLLLIGFGISTWSAEGDATCEPAPLLH